MDEVGPLAAKTYVKHQLVRPVAATPETSADRAKQEVDYGRRSKKYIFGALQLASGAALTEPYASRSAVTFADFLGKVYAWIPAEIDRVFAIMYSLPAHRATDVLLFSLADHRWDFVFQPVDAAYPT